ncbi:MAG TPA: AI-2E family transporter [Ruminococcus sp.]|nr:AI-2E family transporter [Ruminococcus sp.]
MDKKEIRRYSFIALLAVIVCYAVQHLSVLTHIVTIALNALYPLLLGCAIAYLFNIILAWFERHYFPKTREGFISFSRRPVCLLLSFIAVIAIILLILKIVIPEIIAAITLISSKVPPLFNEAKDYILLKLQEYPNVQSEAQEMFDQFDFKSLDWESIINKVMTLLRTGALGIISSAVGIISSFAGAVTTFVVALIFSIYILLRKDKLLTDTSRVLNAYASEKTNRRLRIFFGTAHDTFQSFFIGQFVEAIILGSLCFIGMSILKLPYAGMSGVLVGVTALIPIVGAFIGAGISAFIIATENPMQALIFIIFLVILQQLEGNIIYPKVVGESVGLPGIWVLAAVTVGGGLFGIFGMLIGVPLAATIYKLSFDTLEAKERSMGIAVPGISSGEKKKQEKKLPDKKAEKSKPIKSANSGTVKKSGKKK